MEYYGGVFLDGGIVFLALKQFFHNKDGGVFFEGGHFTKRNIVLSPSTVCLNYQLILVDIPFKSRISLVCLLLVFFLFLEYRRLLVYNMHAQNYLMFWSSCAFFQKIYLIGFVDNVSKERQYKGILFDIKWGRFLEMGAGQL